jgi:hypothetical protein
MPRNRTTITQALVAVLALLIYARVSHAGTPPPVTTILTHGYSIDSKGAWVQGMAQAIIARAGGGSVYRYIGPGPQWMYVPVAGADGSNQAIVLIFNWVNESAGPDNGPNWNYAQAAGDALHAALRDPRFSGAPSTPPADLIADRAVHFIGHSRGACVNSEAIIRLARDDIIVDHMTTLDPHPVDGTLDAPLDFDWNDPTPARWSNVNWADNYWRADGGGFNALDFDGIPIDGAFNTQLSESALNCCAYAFAHSDVHLWLHGTIDLAAPPNACDGEECINETMRNTWWPEGYAERGWFYSILGGGSEQRPVIGPATAPTATPIIVNGDFDNASHAGWSFHGGAVGGQIINESGAAFLRIGAGIGSAPFARHNRFFLPIGSSAVELDTRVIAAANATGAVLQIALTDQNGTTTIVADDPIASAAGGWIADRQFAIPPSIPRGRTYSLTLSIISNGAASAVLGVDNIDILIAPSIPGDVNGDGCVDVDDLVAVILAWGVCPLPPQSCDADADGNGVVDVDDLIVVILNWGC